MKRTPKIVSKSPETIAEAYEIALLRIVAQMEVDSGQDWMSDKPEHAEAFRHVRNLNREVIEEVLSAVQKCGFTFLYTTGKP